MSKKIVLLAITMLSSLFAFSIINNAEADSIYTLLQIENNEEKIALLQLEYAWFTKYENVKKSIKSTEGALFILKENKNKEGIARANGCLGVYMYLTDSIPQSIQYYKIAEKLYIELKDTKHLAKVYNNLGISYSQIYDNQTALEYYRKSLKIKEEDPSDNDVSTNLINISSILYDQGKYEECIAISEKALITTLQKDDFESTAVVYANLGAAHERLTHYQKSVNYALKALSIYQNEIKNETAEIRTYSNLGSTYLSQNMLDEARYYFGLALELTANTHKTSMQAVASNNMAELERVSKNYSKARKYSLSALELVIRINDVEEKMVTLNELHLIEENDGNFEQALSYYKQYISLSDSVMEVSQNFEMEQALSQSKISIKHIQDRKELQLNNVLSKKVNSMIWALWFWFFLISLCLLAYFKVVNLGRLVIDTLNYIIPFFSAGLVIMFVYLKTQIPKTAEPTLLFFILITPVFLSALLHIGMRSLFSKK